MWRLLGVVGKKVFSFGSGWHRMEMTRRGLLFNKRNKDTLSLSHADSYPVISLNPTEGLNLDLVPHPACRFVVVYLAGLFLRPCWEMELRACSC